MEFEEKYFNVDGAEITEHENIKARGRIMCDAIEGEAVVSTVFVGRQVSLGSSTKKVMFSTMAVFRENKEMWCVRSLTESSARDAHANMVDDARRKLGKIDPLDWEANVYGSKGAPRECVDDMAKWYGRS